MKKTTLLFFAAALAAVTSAQAEWKYGIGAGVGAFDIDGDIALAANSGDFEYDTGDMESAFALQGYAATGKWTFRTAVSSLEVEANQTPEAGVLLSDVNFKRLIWDLTAGYKWIEGGAWTISTYAGLRSVSHEVSSPSFTGDFDNTWTDALLGASATYMLGQKWLWTSALEGGFGGSEGSFGASSGLTWKFGQHWSASAILSVTAAEYEEGDSGDADYYLYDANETKLGLGIMYHF
ncbi:MAG: hypothetical protein ACPGGJ_03265 [Coraliomargarita sp.]